MSLTRIRQQIIEALCADAEDAQQIPEVMQMISDLKTRLRLNPELMKNLIKLSEQFNQLTAQQLLEVVGSDDDTQEVIRTIIVLGSMPGGFNFGDRHVEMLHPHHCSRCMEKTSRPLYGTGRGQAREYACMGCYES